MFEADPAREYRFTSTDLYEIAKVDITAGGDIKLSDCINAPGHGHVQLAPDARIDYDNEGLTRSLHIGVEGDCDTVVLVNLPDGRYVFMDDQPGTVDPKMEFGFASSGIYDIWVGTIAPELCPSKLTLETFSAG